MLDEASFPVPTEKAREDMNDGELSKGSVEEVAKDDSLVTAVDPSTASPAQLEKSTGTQKNTRKRSRRVIHCVFCDDKEFLPYCPRTGIPHRIGSLYYSENREMDPALAMLQRAHKIETAVATETTPVKAAQKTEGKSEGASAAKPKREHALSKCLGLSSPNVAASAMVSKPLAAFGFTLKTKSVADPSLRVQNVLIHEFQDNDETRRMSTYWYALREEKSNLLTGLDELLANLGSFDEEKSPSTGSPYHKAHNYEAFLSEVSIHSNPVNEENFDDELVLSSWSAEGYEEIQSRPPYFGTHNLYRELWPKLFNTTSVSLIPQEQILENGYDNSAEEWQSEPSDAESCSSEGESDDDADELNEFDDVVVPDEEETAQNYHEKIDIKDQDIKQIAQERESSRNRNVQRNLLKASRGEIVRARVTELEGEGASKGAVLSLWNLKLITLLGSPADHQLGEDSLSTTSDGLSGLNLEGNDGARSRHSYESIDSFFIKLMQTDMIDRRHVDATLFHPRISAESKKKEVVVNNGEDSNHKKPMLEGNDLQIFIDFVMKHQNSGFNAQILCHEFRKENPILGASYDIMHVLRKSMFRKGDIWKIRPKQEPKLAKTDETPVQDSTEKVEVHNHDRVDDHTEKIPSAP